MDTIADVNASGLWPGRVVTEVAAAGPFWEAEPEHQNYLERSRTATHAISPTWVDPAAPQGGSGLNPLPMVTRRWVERKRLANQKLPLSCGLRLMEESR